jgi:hypothetical protein
MQPLLHVGVGIDDVRCRCAEGFGNALFLERRSQQYAVGRAEVQENKRQQQLICGVYSHSRRHLSRKYHSIIALANKLPREMKHL